MSKHTWHYNSRETDMSQQAVMTCKQAIDMIIALGKLLWEKTEKSSDFEAHGTARQLSRYS